MDSDIKNLTIKDVQSGFAGKKFSPQELGEELSKLIKKENPKLNAYLSVFDSKKVPQPARAKSPLSGIPCAIKDNILIKGEIATAGSKILAKYVAPYDATVIKKLSAGGAMYLGKTNLDEFAMGASTENSAYGPTKNPHDLSRVAGGSSGGSAAAVAAGLAVFALGSDTGGSIRQPAAFCGVVGLKPTYGRVSRYGLIAMASGFDQIGPITKNVYDAALVLNYISGHDANDATSAEKEVPDFTENLNRPISGLRVGIPKEFFMGGIDAEVEETVRSAISKFEKLGAKISEVSLPHSVYALATYYILVPSEVSANLARYDGMRYGYVAGDAENLMEVYTKSRAQGFGPEVRRRIMLGTYALSAGYYDAYYLKAQKVRTLVRKDYDDVFKKVDVIVGPTAPTPAFKIGERAADPLQMYLADIYTVSVNLAGLPAISINCGFAKSGEGKNLPIGLQIIGNKFDEATILRAAHNFENS